MEPLQGKETLQDIAKKLVQEKIKTNSLESAKEHTIFFLGSSSSVSEDSRANFLRYLNHYYPSSCRANPQL